MKKWLFIFVVGLFIGVLINGITRDTFAYPYELDESVLFYENDKELLGENIKKYLEDIDDLLIVNSKYELSDVLVENYDFLVYFAMDYILRYYEIYQDKIKVGNEYSYFNKDLEKMVTNQYISLNDIYEITDRFFGVSDFEFINNDIDIIDDYVSVIDYTENTFLLRLDDVVVEEKDGFILAYSYYEDGSVYVYTFSNDNMVLKLRNIEVLS